MEKIQKLESTKELKKLYDSLLPQAHNYIPCVYCGCPATDKEHVTPISHIQFWRG